jgi:hypothetical protein
MTMTPITALMFALLAGPVHVADDTAWTDTRLQYRVQLTVETDAAGWARLPVDAARITEAINAIEAFKYDPLYFAFNHVRLAAVDDAGRVIDDNVEGGVYLIPEGDELATGALDGTNDTATLQVTPHQFHLLRYTASDGGKCPLYRYEAIFPPGDSARRTDYRVSYFPPMLPLSRTTHERLFMPDRRTMELEVRGRFIGIIHDVSVRRANIAFCAKFDRPGTHRLMLYYQPMGTHHLHLPAHRLEQLPAQEANLIAIDTAQKFIADTQHRLADNDLFGVSFAASTVKITRHMSVPGIQRDVAVLRAAANEAESFQIVLSPKRPVDIVDVTASALTGEGGSIPARQIAIRTVEYIPISRSSDITPARFIGDVGDALLPVEAQTLDPLTGGRAFWVTVRVPAGTAGGTYNGSIDIRYEGDRSLSIPVRLEVFDFELPAYSALQTSLGGQFLLKPMHAKQPIHTIMSYHGIEPTPDNVRKLSHAYYDIMAANLLSPKSVALYDEIGMEWTPPPHGFNVDVPGNYFELHDWDFTAFNETLRHYIDEKRVNSICILHTNPRSANIFMHLPGKRLDEHVHNAPFVVTGWQSFRDCTFIAYGEASDGYKDQVVTVTRDQWDDVVLKYFRRVAQNLDDNGWLDKAYIMVDETENAALLEHFLALLKSDPLTARIQTIACIQGTHLVSERAENDPNRRRFAGLLDAYVPQIDENYDRWIDAYFEDHMIPRDRSSLWNYAVHTARLAIDAPGINNRIVGLDIFQRGASGYLVWDTFAWQHAYGESQNPWVDPWTRHANGSLAFFYPPKRDGVSTEPDWTITPSLRLETFRDGVNDYDYAIMLEQFIADADAQGGIDTAHARATLEQINQLFFANTNWSQNDAWYRLLRDRIAEDIVALRRAIER